MTFEEFKQQYQKVPVEHYSHKVPDNQTVSVCVITYQHKNYIKDCLEGILMQKTNFPFEILLGEDASTDGTREICFEYAQKFPHKIRLFLHHRENNIKYAGTYTGKFNILYNYLMSKGKYIAICEGDDYWTDPYKLQKQVDILEKNNDLAMCTHETHHLHYPLGSKRTWRRAGSIFYRDIQLYGVSKLPKLINDYLFDKNYFWFLLRSYSDQRRKEIVMLEDMVNGRWFMSVCSVLMKKEVIDPLPFCYLTTGGGHQLTLLLGAMKGGIFHLKDKMAVKRDQETSITGDKIRKQHIRKRDINIKTNNRIKRYECLKKYGNSEQKRILDKMITDYTVEKKLID